MSVKTERELSEESRAHWLKAVAAIELRNFDYAIALLQEILKQEPEFLTGRQLLRRAEIIRKKPAKREFFKVSTAAIFLVNARRELKKDPKQAVEMIEKILESQPYHRQANLVLKQAAHAAGWPETAVFALKTLLEENGRDTKVLHELGRLYHELGDSDQEVEIYHRISEIDPVDAEAARLARDASARASMKSGGWAQAESSRDLIKEQKMAEPGVRPTISAEPQPSAGRELAAEEESLALERARQSVGRDPTDLQLRFELGERFFQAERFREALPELQRARQHPHARLKSMNLLGCCYRELGMLDLATEQLEEAAQEIGTMDATKKEIVYNLGLVYELRGEREKSIAALKQIYRTDYGYRDVAERVERSYERSAPDA
jgi:tetratricopeptide (TPR) repeat protein